MDLINSFWPFILTLVGVIIWFVRLEASTKANTEDIADLYDLRETDLKDAKDSRAATNLKLNRIEDKMDNAFREFRSDIKELLKRGSQ